VPVPLAAVLYKFTVYDYYYDELTVDEQLVLEAVFSHLVGCDAPVGPRV